MRGGGGDDAGGDGDGGGGDGGVHHAAAARRRRPRRAPQSLRASLPRGEGGRRGLRPARTHATQASSARPSHRIRRPVGSMSAWSRAEMAAASRGRVLSEADRGCLFAPTRGRASRRRSTSASDQAARAARSAASAAAASRLASCRRATQSVGDGARRTTLERGGRPGAAHTARSSCASAVDWKARARVSPWTATPAPCGSGDSLRRPRRAARAAAGRGAARRRRRQPRSARGVDAQRGDDQLAARRLQTWS